ncbi:MAG: peptidoglycan-binding ATPase [Pedosphaera sp.]|nr:peptidoglycan-binding ATPase [Pedosphaera sp.]
MDLLPYWNLRERPFETTWDTRFFFQSRDHDEALDRLTFLVEEQTMLFGMLTGEIGCGKTLTRSVFTERLESRKFRVVTQENSAFTFNDLLAGVLQSLDGNPEDAGNTKYARYERLRRCMERVHAEHRHLVLIFDEAQEMSPQTLNELKLLTNLNGAGKNFLTIILVGQPELRALVSGLPAINQRISLRFHLNSLSMEDAANYLRHRLKVAGHVTGELFPGDAVERAFQASLGTPRELNRIAKLSLEYAWLKGFPQVTFEAVDAIVRDLQRHQNLPQS